MSKFHNKNSGFTLIEFVFVISFIGFFLLLGVQSKQNENNQQRGRDMGIKLMEFNQGVSRFISINTASSDFRAEDVDGDNEITYEGVDWLRSDECTNPGLADDDYLPCDFSDGLPNINGTTFVTRIDVSETSFLNTKTHVDIRDGQLGQGALTKINESMLGLAALTATGGDSREVFRLANNDGVGSDVDANGNAITKIFLGSTDNEYVYCLRGLDVNLLSPLCTIDGLEQIGGILVSSASSESSNDSWLRTDGSTPMDNRFTFNDISENRDIAFVDRLYNITNEILIIGNTGIFDPALDDFNPILGSGIVFDTNSYIKGTLQNDLNIQSKGQVYSQGDIISDSNAIALGGIGSGGNLDVAGNLTVSDNSVLAGGLQSGSILSTNQLRVGSIIDAQGYYVLGTVVAERVATSQFVRASEMLISDQDISITEDGTFSGNLSVDQNLYTAADTFVEGNIAFENGASYLSSVYSDFIIDNDGDYLIDPSNISLLNLLRTGNLAPSQTGETLNLNAQAIYFASENIECNVNDRDFENCATSVGGYVNMEDIMIKSPEDSTWVSFLDVLNGFDQYNSDVQDEIYEIGEVITTPIAQEISGYSCNGSTFAETMGTTEANRAMNSGWSCTRQDNYIDQATGEDLYLCTASCATPVEPAGTCTSSGVLDETVEVNGSLDNVPSTWSCSETDRISGVPVYTCEIGCTPEAPQSECRYDNNNLVIESEISDGNNSELAWSYEWDGAFIDVSSSSFNAPSSINNGAFTYSIGNLMESLNSSSGGDSFIAIEYFEICRENSVGTWSAAIEIGRSQSYVGNCPNGPFAEAQANGFPSGNNRTGTCTNVGETYDYSQVITFGGNSCEAVYMSQVCS